MSRKKRWIGRAMWALARWLDNVSGPPFAADFRRFETAWDYAQADTQSVDDEPDSTRLWDATSIRNSEPEHSVSEFFALAEQNSPRAINEIGERYYWGRGVAVDRDEGERWFKRAFERGSWRGLLNYGKALYWREDLVDAESVFQVGVERDWGPALYWQSLVLVRRPFKRRTRS
ncbi:MAG TPA: hypothetical protein VG166_02760, partial [Caulobacteraceae bacterium]|nr:hypothetical protein [Caulobacteraceae bacterium]